jgi:Ca2+-transporting ATPase
MILADDNFATIVAAVGEGRRIYDNIRKAIQFLLASNLSEVLAIFAATLIGFTIFQPVQLLWINLITDCFPALALGMEKPEANVMKRNPRDSKEGIFAGGLGFAVGYQGVLVTIITLASYFIGHWFETGNFEITDSVHGTTMAFLTLAMCEVFHSFNMRSLHGSIFAIKNQNMWLWGAGVLSLILTSVVVLIDPIAKIFGMTAIGWEEYLVAMALGFSIIPIVELIKIIHRAVDKRNEKN